MCSPSSSTGTGPSSRNRRPCEPSLDRLGSGYNPLALARPASRASLWRRYLLDWLCRPSTGQCGRLGVFGAPGSGKTSLMHELIGQAKQYGARVIWVDSDPPPAGIRVGIKRAAVFHDVLELASTKTPVLVDDPAIFDRVISACWHLEDALLVIDEAHNLFPRRKCPMGRLRLLLEGRRRSVAVVLASQRPAMLHPTAQNILTIVAVGTLMGGTDSAFVRHRYGVKHALPPYKFLIINPGMEPRRALLDTKPIEP